jgi:hypothetical protein
MMGTAIAYLKGIEKVFETGPKSRLASEFTTTCL